MQTPAQIVTDYDNGRLERLRQLGVPLFPHYFPQAKQIVTAAAFQATVGPLLPNNDSELKDKQLAVAGRVGSVRNSGKLMFVDVNDQTGKTQVKIHAKGLVEGHLPNFDILAKELREGDIVGAFGHPSRTKRGELTLEAAQFVILTPRLRLIPPELKDEGARMRDRSLDLIVNAEHRAMLMKRAAIIATLRQELAQTYGMLEIETPILQPIAGGADAKPFVTHHNALDADMFLRIAPELWLKMAVVAGFHQGVFEIGHNFRNESIDATHAPEFTAVEWYKPYADYSDAMDMTEKIFQAIAQKVGFQDLQVTYSGMKSDWKGPWKRIDYLGSLKEALGNPPGFPADDKIETPAALAFFQEQCRQRLPEKFKSIAPTVTKYMDALFGPLVEDGLVNPTFVCNHPQIMCPLAKYHRSRPGLTERFELFIFKREIANSYTELNDPVKQRIEFEKQLENRKRGDDEAQQLDETFCRSLEFGLPPTAGCGYGIDRLVMYLTGAPLLREIQWFPLAPATLLELKQKRHNGPVIGIRTETKCDHERRAPLAPQHVRQLVQKGYRVLVQTSGIRAFGDEEYRRSGAEIVEKLDEAALILGVKELVKDDIVPHKTYMTFSHVFKNKQHWYNMRRLKACIESGIRLIDYELILDPDTGNRAMKFGPYAGMASLTDSLHGLGLRLWDLGYATPFLHIGRAYSYRTVEEMKAAVRRAGEEIADKGLPAAICPLTFVFTSNGDCSREAQVIFKLMPHIECHSPEELASYVKSESKERHALPFFIAMHEHMVRAKGGPVGIRWDEAMKKAYYASSGTMEEVDAGKVPRSKSEYTPIFHEEILPYTSVLVNCLKWDRRFHRLVSNEQLGNLERGNRNRLLVLCDVSADPLGSVEAFVRDTNINCAFYTYDPATGQHSNETTNVSRSSLLIYGVGHSPAELPRDATSFFADHLLPYVEKIAVCAYEKRVEDDKLPPEVQAAMITYRGKLTPKFAYLQGAIDEFTKPDPAAEAADKARDTASHYIARRK